MTLVPVEKLHPYPGNARRGDVDLIADSLRINGQYKPIVVNKGEKEPDLTNTVLCGNHTLAAAKQLGWGKIDVHWVDYDAPTARKVVLVDNKANDTATYDVDALVDLLTDYPDLEGTGFTRDDVDALLETIDERDADIPDLPPEEPPTEWNILVECESENAAKHLKAKLTAEGYTCGLT